jgi:dTDP-L-rhamnose 4-epimerase
MGDGSKVRALVTGGAGFIGSHIVEALLARGDQVSVLDNLDPRVHGKQVPSFFHKVNFIHGDLLSQASISEALKDQVDLIFHEAAMVGLGKGAADAESYVSTNVIGTVRLMDAIAKQSRRPRFILASTMAIYGEGAYNCRVCGKSRNGRRKLEDLAKRNWELCCVKCGGELEPLSVTEDQPPNPSSIYAITKLNQELISMSLGREFDIPVVALRYHNVYGPRMPRDTPYAGVASIFKSQLLAGVTPTVYEDGRQLRDFIHVEDIVQANLIAADGPEEAFAFEAFNVGTGRPHQILDFAVELAKSLAPELKPQFPGSYRFGDVRHIFACISKIKQHGFAPRVSFEEGVSRFAHEPTRESPRSRSHE